MVGRLAAMVREPQRVAADEVAVADAGIRDDSEAERVAAAVEGTGTPAAATSAAEHADSEPTSS